jgi:hypothetical protein
LAISTHESPAWTEAPTTDHIKDAAIAARWKFNDMSFSWKIAAPRGSHSAPNRSAAHG